MILESATIDEVREMFLRLQNGTPLNAQQKRDAMGSTIGRTAKDLAGLNFFEKSVNFPNSQSAHHLVASQMLLLEISDRIVTCTSPQMDKIYQHYRSAPLDSMVVKRTKKILTILGEIFPEKNPHLNQNYGLTLYWLLSQILLTYNIPEDQYSAIRKNFEDLDIKRSEAMDRSYLGPDDEMFEDLSLAMSRGNTGTYGITTRHDIVGQFLFEGINLEELPQLDSKRLFTHEEKLILYHRSNGYCQLEHDGKICEKKISFEEAVVDHIVPHSKEGKTILANGRIAYKSCNIARGIRDDFNPETECHYGKED